MARSSEQWVRPPVVARELASSGAAKWRFRALAIGALLLVVIVFVLLFLRFSNITGGEDPGIGALSRPAPAAPPAAR